MELAVIIVAAGTSSRMGFDKLAHPLAGKPVLAHSVKTFLDIPTVGEVIVVSDQHHQLLPKHKKLSSVGGGQERYLSVMNGLNALRLNLPYIAVHDGARPLISAKQIDKVLAAAQEFKAATSARPITDTVKRSNSKDFSEESISRENLWAMETPQIFSTPLLKKAYNSIIESDMLVTDEVSAIENIGIKTKFIANDLPNPKVTFPEDFIMAERLIINQS